MDRGVRRGRILLESLEFDINSEETTSERRTDTGLFIRFELHSLGSPAPGGSREGRNLFGMCASSFNAAAVNDVCGAATTAADAGPEWEQDSSSSFHCQKVKPTDVKRTNVV